MGLVGALHTARTGLVANQTALQVVGNNLANAATEGYSRQRTVTVSGTGVEIIPGAFVGTGVRLAEISRSVDEALLARLRTAISDHNGALARQDVLSQIETIENELSDHGVSSRLNRLFNAFSEVAGSPTDNGLRALAIAEGEGLAQFITNLHRDLVALRNQVDDAIGSAVRTADGILDQIAELNSRIVTAERGLGGANELRDERDRLLGELSDLIEISTIEQPNGTVDVFVGSLPIVLNAENRGLHVETRVEDGELKTFLRITADGSRLEPRSGRIGALIETRETDVNATIGSLDEFTGALIFELNKLHSSGQGIEGFSAVTSTEGVDDAALALNDDDAGLEFDPVNGSFVLHVTQLSTGQRVSSRIEVDLDGVGADTTLTDLAAAINGVGSVTATITANGRLAVSSTSSDFRFSFSEDSSGVLAALGINTFFSGTGSNDIRINTTLKNDPRMLAVGKDHITGDNRTALAISQLGDQGLGSLAGLSLRDYWRGHVENLAIQTDQTARSAESAALIREGLKSQRESVSGVNVDEEAIDMLAYQRAFQGSARFISVIDELMQTLLTLVG